MNKNKHGVYHFEKHSSNLEHDSHWAVWARGAVLARALRLNVSIIGRSPGSLLLRRPAGVHSQKRLPRHGDLLWVVPSANLNHPPTKRGPSSESHPLTFCTNNLVSSRFRKVNCFEDLARHVRPLNIRESYAASN